jgi:hypothetical protein
MDFVQFKMATLKRLSGSVLVTIEQRLTPVTSSLSDKPNLFLPNKGRSLNNCNEKAIPVGLVVTLARIAVPHHRPFLSIGKHQKTYDREDSQGHD